MTVYLIIAREITKGTKHLKALNVSYNILNNIREGTLANLTTLEILDISGNGLVDKVLNDTRVFGTQVQQVAYFVICTFYYLLFSKAPISQGFGTIICCCKFQFFFIKWVHHCITSFQRYKRPETKMHTSSDFIFGHNFSCSFTWRDSFCSEY